jgi:hypothetical protein
MTACSTDQCGLGNWSGPKPGDPDNASVLTATPAFGGVDVSWAYPTTNPHAVSYTIVYRGILEDFNSAIVIANVGGNFFYDKMVNTTPVEYFYWIRLVSINGTQGELIGPARGLAKPPLTDVITGLSGKIDSGTLATSLRNEIDLIQVYRSDYINEANARNTTMQAFSSLLVQYASDLDQLQIYLTDEIISRQNGETALVTSVNAVAIANNEAVTAIEEERTARIDADSAISQSVTSLGSQINNPTTGLAATRSLLINDYYTKAAADSAISTATSTLISTTAFNTALGNYTTTSALQTNYFTKTETNSAISSAITTSQATLNNNIASVETTLQTNISSVAGEVTAIGALYTAKVSVNGLIGGFGIYNDGTEVEAGFDVDSFWVGKTQQNKRKPFIVEGGTVFIDDAAINKLTFTKLRDESGSVMVEDGKLKAEYLEVQDVFVGGVLSSDNFVAGQTGWRLNKSGSFENNGTVAGQGRMVLTNNALKVYDENGVLRVHIGDLTA